MLNLSAKISIADHDFAIAHNELAKTLDYAINTKNMPITAKIDMEIATLATAEGKYLDAAEQLGAAARLRGADDASEPDMARVTATLRAELGADGFAAAYAAGRALDPQAARARLKL